MALNLLKLCVGAETIDDLDNWVKKRAASNKSGGRGYVHDHVTRMFPRRAAELLDGGSIYWVIKGHIQARQLILRIDRFTGEDNVKRCAIWLDPSLVATVLQSKRAFQGWRYLNEEDAPADLKNLDAASMPPPLRAELAELGLL